MKSIPGKKFTKILERHGWQLLRINGSHHIYGKIDNSNRISVLFTEISLLSPDY